MKRNWKKCPRFDATLFGLKRRGLTAEKLEEWRCEEIETRLCEYKKDNNWKRKRDDALQGYY